MTIEFHTCRVTQVMGVTQVLPAYTSFTKVPSLVQGTQLEAGATLDPPPIFPEMSDSHHSAKRGLWKD